MKCFLIAACAALPLSTAFAESNGAGFNPKMSLILNGAYYNDDRHGDAANILSHADGVGFADEGSNQGFNLGETELVLSAPIDVYFDGFANLAISKEGEVGVEEAWFETRSLPMGFKIRAGQLLSGFGYLNSRHPHAWDFVDGALPYRLMLGESIGDAGIQVTWLPATDNYMLFGIEALQGDQEHFGALANDDERAGTNLADPLSGPRLLVGYFKMSPNLAGDNAAQVGVSMAYARQHQEVLEDAALQGNATLFGIDAVYKHFAQGAYGDGAWKIQSEYLYQAKDLDVASSVDPAVIGDTRNYKQDGLYVQGVYGFASRWSAAARWDAFGLTNTSADVDGDASDRYSLALTVQPTEFSSLRLQVDRASVANNGDDTILHQFAIQYIHSLGEHGAHQF